MEHLLWSSQIEFQLLCRFWVLICITKGHHCLCKLDIYSHSRVENVQYACTQLVQATVLPTRKHKRHPNYKKLLPSNFQVSAILPMLQQHAVNDITLTLIFRNFQKSSKGEILIFQVQNSSEMTIISLILRQWEKQRLFDSVFLKTVLRALALQQTWADIFSPSQISHYSLATANSCPTSVHVCGCEQVDKPMWHVLKFLQSNSSFCFS